MTKVKLSEKLHESLRGRTTDVRGTNGVSDSNPSNPMRSPDHSGVPVGLYDRVCALLGPELNVELDAFSPRESFYRDPINSWGWIVHFPKDQYGLHHTQEHHGKVPMNLVGHRSISNEVFKEMIGYFREQIEMDRADSYGSPEFLIAPVDLDNSDENDVYDAIDLAFLTSHGRLAKVFSHVFKSGQEELSKIKNYIERLYNHPMTSARLDLARSDRMFTVEQLVHSLRGFHDNLIEPYRDDLNQGDVFNALAWPFGNISHI